MLTKEEAIKILSTRDAHGVLCGYTSGVTEALDMAIEALNNSIQMSNIQQLEAENGVLKEMVKFYREKKTDVVRCNNLEWKANMINYDDILSALEVIKFVCESTNDEGSGCMYFEVSPLCWDLVEHTNSWRAFK